MFTLPDFSSENVDSWLKIIESKFTIHNINDPLLKYHYTLSSFSPENLSLLSDVASFYSSEQNYDKLILIIKDRFIAKTQPSDLDPPCISNESETVDETCASTSATTETNNEDFEFNLPWLQFDYAITKEAKKKYHYKINSFDFEINIDFPGSKTNYNWLTGDSQNDLKNRNTNTKCSWNDFVQQIGVCFKHITVELSKYYAKERKMSTHESYDFCGDFIRKFPIIETTYVSFKENSLLLKKFQTPPTTFSHDVVRWLSLKLQKKMKYELKEESPTISNKSFNSMKRNYDTNINRWVSKGTIDLDSSEDNSYNDSEDDRKKKKGKDVSAMCAIKAIKPFKDDIGRWHSF
ncbi:hypothetical protein BLOT_016734 [Blomia tropicalis]|nr:hypothetical protein BLOT_016734 [Blomia tropicalis]